MTKTGIIGLGRMGSAIAQRMRAQGHIVQGWTRSGRAVDGIATAANLSSLIDTCDTLILSLLDDTAVASVLDTCLTQDLTGKIIIDTSTVVPTIIKDRISRIEAKGALAVDAPISGGPELVLAGQCSVFIGGSDDAAARAEPILSAISGRVFHVGPLGTGLVMKTINNSMLQCYFSGLDDMMPLAKRAGLPLETALRILCGGPAGIPMIADRIPKILGDDETVGFEIQAAHKDNGVFQRVVEAYGLSSPILALAGERQKQALADGLGAKDPAALVTAAYNRG
ncbi:3-hydroxyisobutyrate dehydrogenase [Loktanella sp. PT4BL]|jgi:3-hydroxyisobutyrate dehydrogenase-like beta-hydroxyacid dehydrogenase|uniref:NAD(P)-dependent oxidoreductase n=1 Tax=Loktanella sp. PT4BL TaxID=2135611 RepID=UPI000D76CEC7|nr:NAD(P)-dependent oxidoreductase [Loktanella sp. PT4BL]PXW72589.1 3-hydroxyisobutyrate dehydrogenase [Loktanella sp. PT4BL]